jgi:hypothetical protein
MLKFHSQCFFLTIGYGILYQQSFFYKVDMWPENGIMVIRFVSAVPSHSLSGTKALLLDLYSILPTIQHAVNSPTGTEISQIQLNTDIVILTYVQFWIRK